MKYLIELSLFGNDSFGSNRSWIDSVTGSLFCPHCHNIYSDADRVDAIVENSDRKTDLDLIAVYCGRVHLLSTHFINLVGIDLVSATAKLGCLFNSSGHEYDRYRTAIARDDTVIVRGPMDSSAGLCRECGRILYWPIGEKYVIRSELPAVPFFISDGHIFCTIEFYEQRIKTAKLNRVQADMVPIFENPIDNLPVLTKELKESLRSVGKLK